MLIGIFVPFGHANKSVKYWLNWMAFSTASWNLSFCKIGEIW